MIKTTKLSSISVLLFLALTINNTTFSQNFNWIKSAYRTDCNNGVYPRDIATTYSNNDVISVGHYYSNTGSPVNFDGTNLTGYTTNSFESNIFIAKYNNLGALQFVKRIGTDRSDGTYPRVDADTLGNFYVAADLSGITSGSTGDVAGTTMSQTVLPNDAVVAKFNSSGNVLWYKHFRGTGSINIYDIKTDGLASVYITGRFNGAISLDTNNFVGSNGNNSNFFVAKLNSVGNLIWWKSATGTGSDAGYRLHVNDSDIYVLGMFGDSNTDIDMTFNGTTYTLPNTNYDGVFTAKLNFNGNVSWLKYGYLMDSGGGNGTTPYYSDITIDNNDNVYSIFSLSQSGAGINFAFPGSSITYSCTGSGGSDYLMTKYSSSGTLLWAKGNGGNTSGNNIFPTSMIMHSAGYLYSTFMIAGTVGIDNTNATSTGSEDALITKFDTDGNLKCKKQYGGTNQDWPMAIKEMDGGKIAYTGHVFGGTTSATITSYDAINITGCRNTGITAVFDTTICSLPTNLSSYNFEDSNISLYPNPCVDLINIKVNQMTDDYTIKIYNVYGQQIFVKENIHNRTFTQNISDYASGIYLIEIISNDTIFKQKFIKE